MFEKNDQIVGFEDTYFSQVDNMSKNVCARETPI